MDRQIVGNVGLYYVCYRLSLLGWNVMPTSRNARGVDVVAYNRDASVRPTVQVKALSSRTSVPLGTDLTCLLADFLVVCRHVRRAPPECPECFVLTRAEVGRVAGRDNGGARAYWIAARYYEADEFRERWDKITLPSQQQGHVEPATQS